MIGKIGFAGLALALAMAAACTPAGGEGPAEEVTATTSETAPPNCAEAETGTGTMIPQIADCQIELGAGFPRVTVSSDPIAEGEGTVRLEVIDMDGNTVQQIEETVNGAYGYPYAEDIDRNGTLDLMVPLYTGNVNTNYAVWLAPAEGGFARVGELSGVSIGATSDGLIAASGRSNASEWETGFYRVTNGALEEVAAVVNRADPEPGEPPLTVPACEVIRVMDGVDPAPFCGVVPTSPG